MNPIIVPTDFSPVSLNAAEYAADMAGSINTSLSLLNVFVIPMTYSEAPYPAESIEIMMKEAEDRIIELKNDLIKKSAGKIKIETEVRVGTVVTQIEEYCAEQKPYAIVMGTQDTSNIERVFFGSNTLAVMKRLHCPLIVVPPEAKFTSIKKIGLACDLKKVDETIPFAEIKTLIKEFNAELHVLHVNPENEKNYTAETLVESRSLQNMLEDLHPVYHFLNDTDIEEGLNRFSEDASIDLLIIIPKKHNIIDQLFHKSQSKKLVLHTHIPVMAVHE